MRCKDVAIFQMVHDRKIDRSDHVWLEVGDGVFKCVFCGAVTEKPPAYPTPKQWMPEFGYEPVLIHERALLPFPLPASEGRY